MLFLVLVDMLIVLYVDSLFPLLLCGNLICFYYLSSLTAITVPEPLVFLILQLRKLGAKNIEAGIGCGVGFGHGFGVGMFEEEMCCLSFMHDVDVRIA